MKRPSMQIGLGIALGAGIGIAVGVALGTGGAWLAIGIAIGVVIGVDVEEKRFVAAGADLMFAEPKVKVPTLSQRTRQGRGTLAEFGLS